MDASKTQLIQHFKGCDQVIIQTDLKGDTFHPVLFQETGHGHYFLMLHLDQRICPHTVRHLKGLPARKGLLHDQAAPGFVILHVRVHHLIQHCPYIKPKHDRVRIRPRHRQITPIFDMKLCHLIQKLRAGILGKHIDHAGIDTETDQRHLSALLPCLMTVKIILCHRLPIAVFYARAIGGLIHGH